MRLATGAHLGAYEILASIGAGGMGEVYRARDTRLNRDVALKTLPHGFADDPERLLRFEREAQILATLNHTNIAHIYGVETHGASQALVMELVPGRTLAAILADTPSGLPLDEVVSIARQIAEALEAAHERGVVHRDLKPGNVMLTDDDQVKVLDFGLARVVEEGAAVEAANSPTMVSPATVAGVILGTAAYMAPEQARGRLADKRSDIWSFGCVLYEMLTGTRAFPGDNIGETLANVIKAAPDWTRMPPAVPPAIRVLVERCLVKDRHERLGDVSTVKFLLSQSAALVALAPPSAGGAHAASRRGPLWVAGSVLLAAAAAAGGWALRSAPTEPRTVTRFRMPLADGQEFVGGVRHAAVSPDGTMIAYAANRQLYLRRLNALEAVPIPGTADDPVTPAFSPDGRWLAYATRPRGTLKKIAVTGGSSVVLADLPAIPAGLSWQNGMILFGMNNGDSPGIASVPDGAGAMRTLIPIDPKIENASQPELVDDTNVLFTLRRLDIPAARGGFSLVVQGIDGSSRKTLVAGASAGNVMASGRLVYLAADNTLRVAPFDTRRLEVTGEAVVAETGVLRQAVSRNGTLVYEGAGAPASRLLVWVDRNGTEQPMPLAPAGYFDVRLSPDGKRIAMCIGGDIWMWSSATETLSRLTMTNEAVEYNPMWMPGGRHVAFDSFIGSERTIQQRAADGTGATTLLARANGYPETISPDGRYLVYHTQANVGLVQPLDPAGQSRTLVAKVQAFNADLSPDGRWIAYQSDESGRFEVYVEPFPAMDASRWQVSGAGGAHPLWARNGRELFFIDGTGTMTTVPVQTAGGFSFGKPAGLFAAGQYFVNVARDYDVSLDGSRFLFVKSVATGASRPSFTVVTHWADELAAKSPAR